MLKICPQGSRSSGLIVLDTSLETVYAWPAAQRLPRSQEIVPAWTPSSIVTAAGSSWVNAPPAPPLKVVWHESRPKVSSSREADLARVLLAGLKSGQRLKRLVWAPVAGAAALTQVLGGKGSDCLYTLYVQLPGSPLTSTELYCSQDGRVVPPTVEWSPIGECLAVDGYLCLELFTSSCTLVVRAEGDVGSKAAFSPDGRHMAAVCRLASESGMLAVNIYRTRDGALLFSQPRAEKLTGNLAFNTCGDQLVFTGTQAIMVISFGQAYKPSLSGRQLCEAMSKAGSRAGADFEKWQGAARKPVSDIAAGT